MNVLTIYVHARGLSWPLVYWVAVSTLGVAFEYDNLRATFLLVRRVRNGEPEERPMRASSAGLLAVHLAVAAILAFSELSGLALLDAEFVGGLDLQFASVASQAGFIGFVLVLPTGGVLVAGLLWLWRQWTLRALRPRRGRANPGRCEPVAVTTVIAIQNHSTALTDAEVQAALPDFQLQVSRDFAPIWGRDASLVWVKDQPMPAGAWQIAILDDSDQAGALGYHDVTPDGMPLAKVFVKTTEEAHDSWTVVFSHELLEMLADPLIDSVTFLDNGAGGGWLIPVEVGDPVQGDQYGYKVGTTLVTDFVYPAWFQAGSKGPWDQGAHLSQPLYVLPGCYASVAEAVLPNGWQQVFGDLSKGGQPRPGGPIDPDDPK